MDPLLIDNLRPYDRSLSITLIDRERELGVGHVEVSSLP